MEAEKNDINIENVVREATNFLKENEEVIITLKKNEYRISAFRDGKEIDNDDFAENDVGIDFTCRLMSILMGLSQSFTDFFFEEVKEVDEIE